VYTQALVANGAKVYITGRRLDVLETTARVHGTPNSAESSKCAIIPIAMDVTDKESIKKAVDQITEKEGYLNMYAVLTKLNHNEAVTDKNAQCTGL
jgi:NADP-dependent 3-hydroxy acid dehydrogenase YdfG